MRTTLFLATAVISFVVCLVIYLPAAPLWAHYHETVYTAVPGLRVYRVSGTVWTGTTDFQYRNLPLSTLEWQLSPWRLLTGTVAGDLTIDGDGLRTNATVTYSRNALTVRGLTGHVDADVLNTALATYGLQLVGRLTLSDVGMTIVDGKPHAAAGTASWNGGPITVRQRGGAQQLNLPALAGSLTSDSSGIIGRVTERGNAAEPLLDLQLKADGVAMIEVHPALFTLAGVQSPGDSVVYEEKIL